jgi:hypothetical protein
MYIYLHVCTITNKYKCIYICIYRYEILYDDGDREVCDRGKIRVPAWEEKQPGVLAIGIHECLCIFIYVDMYVCMCVCIYIIGKKNNLGFWL